MAHDTTSPIGHEIAAFTVVGIERDGSNRWIGADVLLDVMEVGPFVVHVLTKQAYVDEQVLRSMSEVEQLEAEDFEDRERSSTQDPFLLNDAEITEEVLQEKFQGRVIRRDLAVSLWRVVNHEDDGDPK